MTTTIIIRVRKPVSEGTGYRVWVEEYDQETGRAEMLPGLEGEFSPGLNTRITKIVDDLRRNGGNTQTRAAIGAELFAQMARTPAGQEWFLLWQEYKHSRQVMLRVYLDIEPASLRQLPWELMIDTADRDSNRNAPFRSDGHRPMRGDPSPANEDNEPIDLLPIRLLVVICDIDEQRLTRTEQELLSPEAEVDAIYAALRKQPGIWQIEVLRKPSWTRLRETLKNFQPQILHFIGETYGIEDPAFRISGDGGTSAEYRFEDIEKLFLGEELFIEPRLFILNGCRTTEMVAEEKFRGLGTRAIVTNQAVVYGAPAIRFSGSFYQALAETGELDEAVWRARVKLWTEFQGDPYDWGIPVLTVQGDPGTVIRRDLREIAERAWDLISEDDYDAADLLVDRLDPSRKVWGRARGKKHLALITGKENSGKSQLLRSCKLTWKLRGHPAILLDPKNMDHLEDGRLHPSTREILLNICDLLMIEFGSSGSVIQELTVLKRDVSGASYRSSGYPEAAHPYQLLCERLIGILEAATADQPLMIAFDRIGDIMPVDLGGHIKDDLFEPVARGKAGHTCIVIAIKEVELAEGGVGGILGWSPDLSPWSRWVEIVKLSPFFPHEAELLGREYGARKGWVGETHPRHGTNVMSEWVERVRNRQEMQVPWLPSDLRDLAQVFEQGWLR